MVNLSICQICNENPAVYGDGITWSECSACNLKSAHKSVGVEQKNEGFSHEIVKGLVSIIIPVYMTNYTLFHYTGNCIGSVREHTNGDFELIIVDNGSPLQPPSLKSYYADKVIKNTENLGVTKAWNQGIRMSKGEYIVLLNNDVQVFAGWKDELVKGLEDNDLVMAHPMYSLTEPFARSLESWEVFEGNKKFDPIPGGKDFSCAMFKRSLVDEIGLFDERFFSYCSDSDFFERMRQAGKKWAMIDHVAVSHISDATGYSIPETPEIMNRDKAEYEKKWKAEKEPEVNATPVDFIFRTKKHGNPIFLARNGTYHHIKDPQTLEALGFKMGQEILIDDFPNVTIEGEAISMENYKNYVS